MYAIRLLTVLVGITFISSKLIAMHDPHQEKAKRPLYLNIIWHQHQPLYLDPETDQLQGPWVRTHGTKDYYDMVSILERYPEIHVTVNLTSSLLFQLQEYYVARLIPFLNTQQNRMRSAEYFEQYGGKTDPWIDIALKPTTELTEKDRSHLLRNTWNAFGVSDVMIERFPAYNHLRGKLRTGDDKFAEQELRDLKFWFFLAHFDPDFFDQPVQLASGKVIDLTDLIGKMGDGTYELKKRITEDDCNRIVAETAKVLEAIIPVHRKFMYDPAVGVGQLEVITTPYYHPILPLLVNSDLARIGQPTEDLPGRFSFPEDADAQVAKSVLYFRKLFGRAPAGMWPAEGSVAQEIVPIMQRHGIKWIATDEKVLARSRPGDQPKYFPYTLGDDDGGLAIVFRDTELSDKIGFTYQDWEGDRAADDFVEHVLRYVPDDDDQDRLLTVILDGENAWEWYRKDNDAKLFLNTLYEKLTNLQKNKRVITVTPTEYISGNPRRNIPPHPSQTMRKLEWLWPGSWINASYDTWIGEHEENKGWEYLRMAREDLGASGIPAPTVGEESSEKGSQRWYGVKAWEAMYAAEGSDWFWWYGTDQTAPGGDKPFDAAFITLLNNVYRFARLAGGTMPERTFDPILRTFPTGEKSGRGTMAQSVVDLVRVVFQCDVRGIDVRTAIYVAGNHDVLGSWQPNLVRMFDDGTNGDMASADGIWTLEVYLPPGATIEYKFTNSGTRGVWSPSEEFPILNRKATIDKNPGERMILLDRFGKM